MISAEELRAEVRERYPRMEGDPAYRAQVLADLNDVDEMEVRKTIVSVGLAREEDFWLSAKNSRRSLEWGDIEPLYTRGLSDREIGEILGYTKQHIAQVRRKSGHASGVPVVRLDPAEAMHWYRMGCNDHEIGRRIHVSAAAVGKWRRSLGLEMNYKGRGQQPAVG